MKKVPSGTAEESGGHQQAMAVRKDLSSLAGLGTISNREPSHEWLGNFQVEARPPMPPKGAKLFGLRRQSGSGDGAFGRTRNIRAAKNFRACESGVVLRLPPQSKTRWRAGTVGRSVL